MGQIANQMLIELLCKVADKIKLKSKDKLCKPAYNYDSEKERPVIRASICTGEQVAGFQNKLTGEFHEVMLIKNNDDKALFLQMYGLDNIEKEY